MVKLKEKSLLIEDTEPVDLNLEYFGKVRVESEFDGKPFHDIIGKNLISDMKVRSNSKDYSSGLNLSSIQKSKIDLLKGESTIKILEETTETTRSKEKLLDDVQLKGFVVVDNFEAKNKVTVRK